ncbi:hypothetical protein G6F22_012473 [Rhizopus arrhizus]|nr:hypothetical protein G6F22_012473 [Rhizopus arrhizus]
MQPGDQGSAVGPAAGAVRAGSRAGARARRQADPRAGGAEVRPRPGTAVRCRGARLPARGLLRRPGAGRGRAVHRQARGRAVQVRLVAVRRHHLPFAHCLHLGQRPAGVGRQQAGGRARRPAHDLRPLMRPALMIGALLLAAPLFSAPPAQAQDGIGSLIDSRVVFPASASQGALVIGKVPAGSRVQYAGRQLRVSGYGSVVFGIGRDEKGPLRVQVQRPDGGSETATIAVTPRDWPTERVNGVPPKTVNPPPAIAERIKREQAQVTAARARDDDRTDFTQTFIWPVQGRISGRFGNARVYNGQPGAGHSGMDIAVPTGTPVKAPAAGIVTFAGPDLYLTGGTLLLDHGFGVSSNFLHLSRIDVKVGDRVEQGQVIAAVGATGRATGPHLHWGMNWFDTRIDPLLVLERK